MKNLYYKFRIWLLKREINEIADRLEDHEHMIQFCEKELIESSVKLAKLRQAAQKPKEKGRVVYL